MIAIALVVLAGSAGAAHAQIGQLVSPGPLSKAHASVEGASNCEKCHEPGKKVTASLCLSCHKPIALRIQEKRGVHRNVKEDCVRCHVEHAGVDAQLRPFDQKAFNHATETGFAFEGRHAPLAKDCAKCHKTRSFLTASPTCTSCHADVHKGAPGVDCLRCHSTAVPFKAARTDFDHTKAAFRLDGAHQRVACEKCHANKVYRPVKFASCADCHRSPHHQPLAGVCATCHTTATWKTEKFEHAKTRFPLRGAHAPLACVKCHVRPPLQATVKFDRCSACHADPHKGSFKQDCSACHNETSFRKGTFDHATTRFPLTGKHAAQTCVACHKGVAAMARPETRSIDFRGLSSACASCHTDVHKAELGKACEACHTSSSFKVTTFAHPRFPAFFAGQHQTVSCAGCHVTRAPGVPLRTGVPVDGMKFRNLSTACATCHRDVHLGQVGTACERCHTIEAAKFAATLFSHATSTFQLTGRHQTVECRKCHKQEAADFPAGRGVAVRLKGLSVACASCHQDQHLGQLGPKCETCHTTATFKVVAYTHVNQQTFFVGAHATQKCSACHKSQEADYPAGHGTAVRYKVGTTCLSCHADAHRGAMGSTCRRCHTPVEWRTVSRAFHKVGVFPLEGRHLLVDCVACHRDGVIKGTPTRCYDCHWIRRQDDPYQTRLGTDCSACHRPVSWTAVNWDHGAVTGVALGPVHRALGCDGCHKSRTFVKGSVACSSCHAEQYQSAKNPNHAAAGFPMQCELCHRASQASWSQAVFDHNAYFPLAGAHRTQSCTACHKSNIYKGTPRDCVGCHRANYDRTQSPNHAAAGFPTTCESCHQSTASSWQTSFNHNAVFQLSGVHATQACTACHKNNVYKGTPRDCVGCHRTNYDRTTNPNHAAAGFPTTCETCHNGASATWSASFDHNRFFVLAGRHLTAACSSCHVNNVYKGTPRDCYPCHQTSYDKTTNPNHRAASFPTTCDVCHRNTDTSWNQGRFDHTWFPITSGKHAGNPCSACHTDPNNYKVFTCLTCHDRAKMDDEHKGKAGYRYESSACYSCHPTGKGD